MGGDEITPQSKGDGVYLCSWVTKGYQPTRRAVSSCSLIEHLLLPLFQARHDMRVSLTFDKGDLTFPIQCKFYAISDSTHLTWGTAIKNLEVESVGTFESGAAPFQTFPAKRVLFKQEQINSFAKHNNTVLDIVTQNKRAQYTPQQLSLQLVYCCQCSGLITCWPTYDCRTVGTTTPPS